MGLKGIEHSQEIFHLAIGLRVMPKMVIYTLILEPTTHNHINGKLIKVSIINLQG